MAKGLISRIYHVVEDPTDTFTVTADVVITNDNGDIVGGNPTVQVSADSFVPDLNTINPSRTSGSWRQRLKAELIFLADDQHNLTVDQVLGPDGREITNLLG